MTSICSHLLTIVAGRKDHLNVATEVFEVASFLFMVEVRKAGGDTLKFHKFYKNLSAGLKVSPESRWNPGMLFEFAIDIEAWQLNRII